MTAPSSAIARAEPLDLGRQRARAAPRLQRVGQRGDVGLRFGQLLGELLLGQRRRLLLQLHVLDLRARRLELLLGGEARLVARAQFRRQRSPACRAPRPAPAPPRRARPAAAAAPPRPASSRWPPARCVSCASSALLLRGLRGQRFAAALELGQPVAAAALRESRLLRRALGDAHALAAAGERDFGLVARVARGFARGELVVQPRLQVGDLRARSRRAARVSPASLRRDVGRFLRDLRAPALAPLRPPASAAGARARDRARGAAASRPPGLRRATSAASPSGRRRPRRAARAPRRPTVVARRRSRRPARRVRAGARCTPCSSLSGAKNVDALRGDEVPGRRDERLACAQRVAVRQRRREIGAAANAVQAVGEQASDVRLLQAHLGQQRIVVARAAHGARAPAHRRRRAAAAARRRPPSRRLRPGARARARSSRSRSTASSASSHPALDVERLPQPARAWRGRGRRASRRCPVPCPIFACSADSACCRASRSASALAVALPRVGSFALARLQRLHGSAAAPPAPACLPARSRVSCGELLLDFAQRIRRRRGECRPVPVAAASCRAASCCSVAPTLSRRVSATRMSCSVSAICSCSSRERRAASATACSSAGSAACAALFLRRGRFARGERRLERALGRCRGRRRAPLPARRSRPALRSTARPAA